MQPVCWELHPQQPVAVAVLAALEGDFMLETDDLLLPFAGPTLAAHLPQQLRGQPAAQPSWGDFEGAAADALTAEQRSQLSAYQQHALPMMRRAVWRLSQTQGPVGRLECTQQQFAELVQQAQPPIYQAGAMSAAGHRAAWHKLLDACKGSGNVDEVLRIVDEGVRLQFAADPFSAGQQARPQFQEKERVLRSMLSSLGEQRAAQLLRSTEGPPSVWLGNLQSATQPAEHAAFIRSERDTLVRLGVLMPWRTEWGLPHSIHPVGCVPKGPSDFRMIVTPLLLNWYERYQPFRMERRRDAERFVQPGDYLWKWDAKRGYMLVRVHPSCWRYLCICIDGQVPHAPKYLHGRAAPRYARA